MLTDDEINDYQRVGESQTEDLGLDFFRALCAQAREANTLRSQLASAQQQIAAMQPMRQTRMPTPSVASQILGMGVARFGTIEGETTREVATVGGEEETK